MIAYGDMKKCMLLLALAGAYFAGRADVSRNMKLENARVRVTSAGVTASATLAMAP